MKTTSIYKYLKNQGNNYKRKNIQIFINVF